MNASPRTKDHALRRASGATIPDELRWPVESGELWNIGGIEWLLDWVEKRPAFAASQPRYREPARPSGPPPCPNDRDRP
jgi:hypothetical protein